MAHRVRGSKFHPARISGEQKFLRKLDVDEMNKRVKPKFNKIDIHKQNWSTQ